MHARRLIAGLGLGVLVPLVLSTPSVADPGTGRGDHIGWTDGEGVGALAESSGAPARVTTGDGAGSAGAPACSYQALSTEDAAIADGLAQSGMGPPRGSEVGVWLRKVCVDDRGFSTGTVVWAPQPPAVDPAALAQQALGYVPVPTPGIGMNPPSDRDQFVGLPIWLWLDRGGWQPVSASASAGGVTVTVTAVPERVSWDMGNGDTLSCGPGTPYDPRRPEHQQSTDCSYTYRRSSASQPRERYQVTATATWHATWTVSGAPGGGDLGAIRRSATAEVRVAEAQAINTKPSA